MGFACKTLYERITLKCQSKIYIFNALSLDLKQRNWFFYTVL